MKTAFLIGAGEGFSLGVLPKKEDLVVAVDGGLTWCETRGVVPHLTVGDFDSLSYIPQNGVVRRLPVEKDDTDMRVAATQALAEGCTLLHIFGGTGGRADHTFANYQLLMQIAKEGALGILWGDTCLATVLGKGQIVFPKREKGVFSVFAFGGDAQDVSVLGGKYEAENINLSSDYPIGVSNAFLGEQVKIKVTEGFLLVIWEREGDFLPHFTTK